ncbi:MAG: hypothetical protein MZW92_12070 [Comamonadaceae bacterium]|nr:hypothetical protein [Comamonadaceae bacterium]
MPIFPLRRCSIPGMRLPLRIFEQRYMDMAQGLPQARRGLRRVPHPRGRGGRARPRCPSRWAASRASASGTWRPLGILKVKARRARALPAASRRAATAAGLILGDIERIAPEAEPHAPELAQSAEFVRKVVGARWARRASRSRTATTTRAGWGSGWPRSCRCAWP